VIALAASKEPVALVDIVERDGLRTLRIRHRTDWPAADVVTILRDPTGFFLPRRKKRSKKKERRRARRKRLVACGEVVLGAETRRVFVKTYRLRTVKDWFEDLIVGKRAIRALRNGVEAERRGVSVPPHLGASFPDNGPFAAWRPGESTLLMLGLATRKDARHVLMHDFAKPGRSRRAFLQRLGEFCADLHSRGVAHGDLKAGNLIVMRRDPLDFALLDLDRTTFSVPNRTRFGLKDAIDLYRLLQSLRKQTTPRERRRVLAAYRRARELPRFGRNSLSFAIASRFARG
jgi:tRNA A-37 threonylcarbamoyl transferase component Bud32